MSVTKVSFWTGGYEGMTAQVHEAKEWHLAVLIPARNEEKLLPRCLQSVAAARAILPLHVTSSVVVVSDGSSDSTVEIASAMLGPSGMVAHIEAGNVGMARSHAAALALQHCPLDPSRCWFANTDADCEVPVTWLLDQLRAAQAGYSAVAGIVDVNDFAEHLPIVEERFRTSYIIHADGSHPHVHGANLGVRADVYLQAGGWCALETAEDHDLWSRLQAVRCARLSDSRLQVLTSGRRVGRAPLGFAGALAAHNISAAVA